jgi:tetratricopeptide (TPR) repeat protein
VNRKERRQSRAQDRHSGAAGPGSPAVPASDAAMLYAQAANALQSGRLPEAETLFQEVLRVEPGHADAHNWLGVLCGQKGDGRKSLEYLRNAVALKPASADFANNLGITELKLGDLDAAERSFEKALVLNPRLAQAHYNLGLVFQKRREEARAIACFENAIKLVPNYLDAHLALGSVLSDGGKHDEAIGQYRQLIEIAPKSREARFNLITALKTARRYDEAAAEARHVLVGNANSAAAHDSLALFLWSIGRNDEAEAEVRHALALDPKYADAHNTLGTVLTTLGRYEEAIASFEAALGIRPDCPDAITGLTNLSTTFSTPPMAKRIETSLRAADRPPEQRAMLHFALGKIYDDLGDYPLAFEHYRAGNELVVPESAFNAERWNDYVDRLIAVFTPAFFGRRKTFASQSRRPVFIFGMPRSGTTLVEQIIISHPEAAAGGELMAIPDIVKELQKRIGTGTQYPECALEMTEDVARVLVANYLAVLDDVNPDSGRVTDKLPLNFMQLGLLALLFPEATFLHCRRDPLDTCMSCYFAKFGRHLEFSFSLKDLGAYYRGYRRLMAHWRKVLPVKVLDVDYEDLIENQAAVSRRIVAHCGLPWDDRCLDFHKTERPVHTSSAWQVRLPLYKTAVKRWQRYEQFLGPLRAALEGMDS